LGKKREGSGAKGNGKKKINTKKKKTFFVPKPVSERGSREKVWGREKGRPRGGGEDRNEAKKKESNYPF